MLNTAQLAAAFHDLFCGFGRAYGLYNDITPDHSRTDGKHTGKPKTVRGQVSDGLWECHLSGDSGIGIIPIREDNTAVFGACDIDTYIGLDAAGIAAEIKRLNLPIVPCRSKSGGLHLYLFAAEAVPAARMQSKLRELAALLGHGSCEVFPKQTVVLVESNDLGSWINMPYFGGDSSERYAFRPDGSKCSAEEFLELAEAAKQKATAQWITRPLAQDSEALLDGPPCLQHLIEQGVPEGGRNKVLFNLSVYARKVSEDNWKDRVQTFNQEFMKPPLQHEEVLTVIKSVDRKSYGYTCNDTPLCQFCNRGACRTRKFGVGNTGSNRMPMLGSLSKLMTDPPVWFLEVETGQRVECSTDQLLNPLEFQKVCAEQLKGVLLPVVKRSTWIEYLQSAMQNVIEVPIEEEISVSGHLRELLEEFCRDRARAESWEEIHLGMPHTANDKVYFRLQDFVNHVHRKGNKDYKRRAVALWLRRSKFEHEFRKIGGRGVNLWIAPAFPVSEVVIPIRQALTDSEPEF